MTSAIRSSPLSCPSRTRPNSCCVPSPTPRLGQSLGGSGRSLLDGCRDHSYEAASVTLERDWDRMITFYDFPKEHWQHLRTTNPVESPFAALRLRTDAAKRYKRVDRAIAVIWKMLMVAEQRFRRLKAPELIEDVYLGAQYVDGIVFEPTAEKVAA